MQDGDVILVVEKKKRVRPLVIKRDQSFWFIKCLPVVCTGINHRK